jgi:hypothetical protein
MALGRILFATPDFGASGGILCLMLLGWALVLGGVAIGIAWGTKLLRARSLKANHYGILLVLASGLLPLSCCLLPPHAIRIIYGNYPLGRDRSNEIEQGMTREEVVAILGSPHERYESDDRENWYYWIDSFGIRYFAVQFRPEGRVTGTHGN